MLLAKKATGHMIEVLDQHGLFDPLEKTVKGSLHYGEEAQDPEQFLKEDLAFPSGEPLPQCWIDPDYRRRDQSDQ